MALSRRQFVVGTSAFALASPALMGRAQDDTIIFASILDLSGGLDIYGAPMDVTTKMAVDDINAAGGLLGRKVELKTYDAQSSIQLYTQYATQAAAGDRAAPCMAASPRPAARRSARRWRRFKTLYFYNTQYEGGVCDFNNFCTGSTPAQTVAKVVPYAMNKWGKKVYIVAADYNYGQIIAQWMQKFVADNGGETLGVEFFPLDVTNFGPTINKIQQAKPNMVISGLVGGAHVSFYRQYAAAGMNKDIPICLHHLRGRQRTQADLGRGRQRAAGRLFLLRGGGQRHEQGFPGPHGPPSHGRQPPGDERTERAVLRRRDALGRGGEKGRQHRL
jgi:urea transport system substrate-binding protein